MYPSIRVDKFKDREVWYNFCANSCKLEGHIEHAVGNVYKPCSIIATLTSRTEPVEYSTD